MSVHNRSWVRNWSDCGIQTVQSILPLILALVLLGLVHKGQHNPATWSSISNQLQGTLWPFLLRGDGSSAHHVRWRVELMSATALFATLCFTVAGFLTPKPLQDYQRPSLHKHYAQFSYAPGKRLSYGPTSFQPMT